MPSFTRSTVRIAIASLALWTIVQLSGVATSVALAPPTVESITAIPVHTHGPSTVTDTAPLNLKVFGIPATYSFHQIPGNAVEVCVKFTSGSSCVFWIYGATQQNQHLASLRTAMQYQRVMHVAGNGVRSGPQAGRWNLYNLSGQDIDFFEVLP